MRICVISRIIRGTLRSVDGFERRKLILRQESGVILLNWRKIFPKRGSGGNSHLRPDIEIDSNNHSLLGRIDSWRSLDVMNQALVCEEVDGEGAS